MARDGRRRWGGRNRPKIKGLGDDSTHWWLAALAVETGISPRELMQLEDRMLWTMYRWIVAKNVKK